MTKDERLSYVVLVALGFLFFLWIGPSEIDSGENASISPRLLPYIYVALIMVLAMIALIGSLRTGVEGWAISREQAQRFGIVVVAIIMSAWIAGVSWIDRDLRFWIASIPTVLVGLWLTDVRDPRFIGLYTAGLLGTTWVLVSLTGLQLR